MAIVNWDYKVIKSTLPLTEAEMKSYGSAGWELVSIIENKEGQFKFIFKKELVGGL